MDVSRGRPDRRRQLLNASPEAAVGGGLAVLQTGDRVRVDLRKGTVNVLISDADVARRREALDAKGGYIYPESQTPWQEMQRDVVGQMETGAVLEPANEASTDRTHIKGHPASQSLGAVEERWGKRGERSCAQGCQQALRFDAGARPGVARYRAGRVRRRLGAIGLEEIHPPARGCGTFESIDIQGRSNLDGRRIDQLPPGKRGVAMVFQSCAALSAHERAREYGIRTEQQRRCARGSRTADRGGGADARDAAFAGPQAVRAFRRSAPACRHRPRDRERAEALHVRRAAIQSRRRAPQPHAPGDRGPPSPHQDRDDLLRDP